MSSFKKNDSGFVCQVCGQNVLPLKYTSRDHCSHCLCSVHVDIEPGDRLSDCHGVLVPTDVTYKNGEYDIAYRCEKCGYIHKNKSASDDDFSTLMAVMNHSYNVKNFKK